jgi:hypothetical protein
MFCSMNTTKKIGESHFALACKVEFEFYSEESKLNSLNKFIIFRNVFSRRTHISFYAVCEGSNKSTCFIVLHITLPRNFIPYC